MVIYLGAFKIMDPSAAVCISYDSLQQFPPVVPQKDLRESYSQKTNLNLTAIYNQISIQEAPPAVYCDPNRYQILQTVKDAFETEGFIQARDATNPFERIGRSIFINRAAVKLANIDAVHHVTDQIFTFDAKQSGEQFTFCDVAAGPGGFTQYLQYRFPQAIGYGMTLRHEKLNWSTRFIDMNRFTAFYGKDNTGNLYTNWDSFIQLVLSNQPNGVDLITADGGFDLEDTMDKALLHRQEFLSSRLLLTQAIIGISCSRRGGNFVLKVFDTVTEFSAQVLLILAACFTSIEIFKPVSSRPANAERYVVCLGRKDHVQQYYNLLTGAARAYADDIYLNQLFVEPIPTEFREWLSYNNSQSIDRQLQAAQNILFYIRGNMPPIPQYDIDKFLIVWNLPDTPTFTRKDQMGFTGPLLPGQTIIQAR
ncbi:FtsJ methyltransferase [uncultured virus]|nr:FtsJ methyltransferase [uncultured virus]